MCPKENLNFLRGKARIFDKVEYFLEIMIFEMIFEWFLLSLWTDKHTFLFLELQSKQEIC